jgi:hypothetical protein
MEKLKMDFKNIVMTNVLFSTIVGNSVWAQESHVITDGPHTWNDGLTINNVGDWPGSGIKAEENLTATITTHGNIDTSNNFSGLFLSQGASVTFQAVRCQQMFAYQVQTHRFATRSLPPAGAVIKILSIESEAINCPRQIIAAHLCAPGAVLR